MRRPVGPRRQLREVGRTAAWRQDDGNDERQRALYWNDWLAVSNLWPEVSDWKLARTFELANDRRAYRALFVSIGANVEMRSGERHQRREGKRDQRTTDAAPNAVLAVGKEHCARSGYVWVHGAQVKRFAGSHAWDTNHPVALQLSFVQTHRSAFAPTQKIRRMRPQHE
jgi:hypothetical protein